MKSIIKKSIIATLPALFLVTAAIAQPPPPPGEHGSTDNENPFQQAPIGSGLAILVALVAAYGAKKVYNARKRFL